MWSRAGGYLGVGRGRGNGGLVGSRHVVARRVRVAGSLGGRLWGLGVHGL